MVLKKNEEYMVYYVDDTNHRKHKLFSYRGREGQMLVFLNVRTGKREVIPERLISRWEATKKEEN